MGKDVGNAKGHFEDLDFVEFHEQVLKFHKLSVAGWTAENKITVPAKCERAAKNLLATRQESLWGWKDPRTTLFLDFWSQLIPDAKYLFVYRSPWKVLDSLFRRGDVTFESNPSLAVTQWCNYNQAILDFQQRHSSQCLLLAIDKIILDPNRLINLVNRQWDLTLNSPAALYQPSMFNDEKDDYSRVLIAKFFPPALDLFLQLQQADDLGSVLTNSSAIESAEPNLQVQGQILQNGSDRLDRDCLAAAQKKNVSQLSNYSAQIYTGKSISSFKRLKQNFPQKAAIKRLIWGVKSFLPTPPSISIQEPAQSSDPIYQNWLDRHYPQPQNLARLTNTCNKLIYQPLISVIVPIYNPDADFLRQAIESVRGQIYSNWELCLADDCSSKPYVQQILNEYQQLDSRVKVVLRESNGHISRASNSALELATGEYIALLDHDDLLAPHALSSVVELLNRYPQADFIYSDEDKVNAQNIHSDPYFKPDWCPDTFLSRMYTCHLGVYRRDLVTRVGNFRAGFEGSQDYDLVLRVTEKTQEIYHIADVLYHWRIHSQSTAAFSDAKTYAFDAGQKAIADALNRRQEPGKVIPKPQFPGVYTIRYEIKQHKLVSIIIFIKDLANALDTCLKSIFELTTYPNFEVIVIDYGSVEAETFRCLSYWHLQQPDRLRYYANDILNYSQINNFGVSKAKGDYLLFLNNDTEVISSDWIEAMVEQAQRKSIGAVGGLLLYPDDTIQHAGVVLGLLGVAGHGHQNFAASEPGYISQIVSTNNYSAVTGACLMCRREVFERVGGFETRLAIAFNDVDFCLKLISHGYRNVYLPHVVLRHYKSKSQGYDRNPDKQARFASEAAYIRQKWHDICDRDPCYNPNLTKNNIDYRLNV